MNLFIYLFSFAYNYTIKTTLTPNHFCPTPKRENFNATYMIVKLNLGWFNSRIIHIHLICLNFMSPTLENMENCFKTWHRSRQNLSKRSKFASYEDLFCPNKLRALILCVRGSRTPWYQHTLDSTDIALSNLNANIKTN